MKKNQIALKLEGTVDLDEFAKAIRDFNELVQALTKEVGETDVAWGLSNLEYGSAYVESQGYAPTFEPVERIISAYYVVASAMLGGEPIPYSSAVVEPARRLASLIGENISAISMLAGEHIAARIVQPISRVIKVEKVRAIGVLTGQVETLRRRHSSFMLYDSIFDQAVTCYVNEEMVEQLRNAWGKEVAVTGDIIRDPETGRPLEMREIIKIEVKDEDKGDVLLQARGILSHYASSVPSEKRIQEFRHVH